MYRSRRNGAATDAEAPMQLGTRTVSTAARPGTSFRPDASARVPVRGAPAPDEQRESRGALAWRLLQWQSDSAAKLITRACSRRKEGPSVAPRAAKSGGQSPGRPLSSPSMSYPPPVRRAAARRVGSNSPPTWCRGALPPMKRVQRRGAPHDAKGPSFGPARATRHLGRTRRAAPDSASALRVCCGTRPAGMVLQRDRTARVR
jgi:hypothetical protein